MAILVLQHSDLAGPGRLGATLRDHGLRLDVRRPDLGGTGNGVPGDLDDVQALVLLGGAMNVTEIEGLPWMAREAELIRKAHGAELPVIGICLGAQLIAHALGGAVEPKGTPDLGFKPLSLNPNGQTEPVLSGIAWNHYQLFSCGQEITRLPAGALLLGSTPTTMHAAYKAGMRTFGFLFHFECDRPMTEALLADDAEFARRAGTSAGDLAAGTERHYAAFARLSERLCVNLTTYCFPAKKRLAV